MTSDAWLQANTHALAAAGIESARLDCLILLEDATGHDRAWLLAHPEFELPSTKTRALDTKIAKREHHMPLAYIRGHVAFYGREFAVNEHVLVPRPESEQLIELFKAWLAEYTATKPHTKNSVTVVDVGTGSGALAITAKLETPDAHVIGSDISSDCLGVARHNAQALQAACSFMTADLLGPEIIDSSQGVLVVLANLPYVPNDYPVNQAARHEPKLALFAGTDGLDAYRQLWQQISRLPKLRQPQLLITEALDSQHHALATMARHYGYLQATKEGLAQAFTPLE